MALTGTNGNDRLKAGTATTNGTIDGLSGLDTVTYDGSFTDYTINVDNDVLSIKYKNSVTSDQLSGIEKIIFNGDKTQVSVSPESLVNTDTAGAQIETTVLAMPDASGDTGYIVFWEGSDGYYFRKFDSSGVAQGIETNILAGVAAGVKPALQYDSVNDTTNIILAWPADDGDGTGISVQIFNADGTAKSTIFHANDTITDTQSQPSVAVLTDGSFVVAWTSNNQGDALQGNNAMGDTPNQAGVFAQHFDSEGNPFGWEMKIGQSGGGDPIVTALQDGGYTITYEAILTSTEQMNIHTLFFDADDQAGSVVRFVNQTIEDKNAGSKTLEFNEKASEAKLPVSAQLTGGNIVVVWRAPDDAYVDKDGAFTHDGRIVASLLSSTGDRLSSDILVNNVTNKTSPATALTFSNEAYEQTNPAVAALTDGGFVVVWQSMQQDGSYWGVYGQRFDASGNKVGSEFLVNTKVADSQQNPSVAGLADGGFVVSWEAQYQDGNSQGIYQAGDAATEIVQQRYDSNGDAVGNVLAGGNGDDIITTGGAGNIEIDGGAGKDILTSGDGDDVLRGGAGNDILNPGNGTNTVIGGEGIDKLVLPGTLDDFNIDFANNGYTITGITVGTSDGITDYLQGIEKLVFSDGSVKTLNPNITGKKGLSLSSSTSKVETLDGSPDNDTLTGGNLSKNADVLNGGDGNDTYIAIGLKLIISDTDGNDTLQIDNSKGQLGKSAQFPVKAIDLADPNSAANGIIGLDAIENVDLSSVIGSGLKIYGSEVDNVLTGNNSVNTIYGGAGNDTIIGLGGNDTLVGDAGDDIIIGGAGRDKLTGGTGTDIFVFDTKPNSNTNADIITDFSDDKIQLDSTYFTRLDSNGKTDSDGNPVVNFIQGAGLKHASGSSKSFIVYDSKAGNLYYDEAGATGPVLIAKVGIYSTSTTQSTDSNGNTTTTTIQVFHAATLTAADFILA